MSRPSLQEDRPTQGGERPARDGTRSVRLHVADRLDGDTVSVLGVPFSPLSCDDAVRLVRAMLAGREAHHVVLANAHTVTLASADPAYRRILRDASLVLRDGVGVELAALLQRRRLAHNFVGTDFVPHLLRELGDRHPAVFLYGARPGVAEAAGRELEVRCPGIRVVGSEHGYGDPHVAAGRIAAARPDVLLVALGNPRQEEWIATHLPGLGPCVAMGVGALFDYLAGRVRRAPRWVLRLRSEWVFRLVVEPRRLWRRYLVGNAAFLWRVARARDGGPL
jgi:exopolysaccharide biosynthesis WecB/TagA/CpsF family protein